MIRWLRPDYQIPRFAPEGAHDAPVARAWVIEREADVAESPRVSVAREWPGTAVEQALRARRHSLGSCGNRR